MNTASGLVPPASGAAAPAAPPRRQRNARGQGARLTEDIVTGALALIERSGSDEAVTLRAVAREVGISAPSIYAHFADRDAIVMAVMLRVFDELAEAVDQATAAAGQDPVERLVAGCGAYVSYGLAHPARYGVLFSGHAPATGRVLRAGPAGARTAARCWSSALRRSRCSSTGSRTASGRACRRSPDVVADSIAVWVALHGTVTLRTRAARRSRGPSRTPWSATSCCRWPGSRAARRRGLTRPDSASGDAVDGLPEQVGVPVVPRVLADQVHVHHPDRERVAAAGVQRVLEAQARRGRVGLPPFLAQPGDIRLGLRRPRRR